MYYVRHSDIHVMIKLLESEVKSEKPWFEVQSAPLQGVGWGKVVGGGGVCSVEHCRVKLS